MTKEVLNDIVDLENQISTISIINANNAVIETAFDNTLSRDGSTPNQMESSLDMNSNRIINLPEPVSNYEPIRFIDAGALGIAGITVSPLPSGGTSNQVLEKNSGTDFDVSWKDLPTPDIPTPLYLVPEDFGAVGDGVVDDTFAVQSWINAGAATGKELLAYPNTKYRLTENGTSGYCVIIQNTVQIRGLGGNQGVQKAWFFTDPSIRTVVDAFRIRAASAGSANNTVIENVRIGHGSIPTGRAQIYVDTTGGGKSVGWCRFLDLTLYSTVSGWVFYHDNSDGVDPVGGMYLSTIRGGNFLGGIGFTLTGSGHLVDHVYANSIGTSGYSLYYSQIPGGAPSTFSNNIFADGAGAVKFGSGRNICFINNSVESNGTQPGSNGAVADFAGDVAPLSSPLIVGNYFGNLSSSVSSIYNLRIGNTLNAVIGDGNTYTTSNATQIASGYWIRNQGTQTVLTEQGYQSGTVPATNNILMTSLPNSVVYATGDSVGWTPYTPTLTTSGVAFTLATPSASYRLLGKTLFLNARVLVTTVGGGTGYIKLTLPSGITIPTSQSASYSDDQLGLGTAQYNAGGFFIISPNSAYTPGATYVLTGVFQTD